MFAPALSAILIPFCPDIKSQGACIVDEETLDCIYKTLMRELLWCLFATQSCTQTDQNKFSKSVRRFIKTISQNPQYYWHRVQCSELLLVHFVCNYIHVNLRTVGPAGCLEGRRGCQTQWCESKTDSSVNTPLQTMQCSCVSEMLLSNTNIFNTQTHSDLWQGDIGCSLNDMEMKLNLCYRSDLWNHSLFFHT